MSKVVLFFFLAACFVVVQMAPPDFEDRFNINWGKVGHAVLPIAKEGAKVAVGIGAKAALGAIVG